MIFKVNAIEDREGLHALALTMEMSSLPFSLWIYYMAVMPYSIKSECIHTLKIRRSVFICSLRPVSDMASAKEFISEVSKKNKTATHNCWAYIIGESGDMAHSSDAGEPPGTAGKPMLQALRSHLLTNVAAVVTRHFGGIKLGVRGLMDAYALSVEETVQSARKVRVAETFCMLVTLPYDFNDLFLNRIAPLVHRIEASRYLEKVSHEIVFDVGAFEEVDALLEGYRSRGRLEYILLEDGD